MNGACELCFKQHANACHCAQQARSINTALEKGNTKASRLQLRRVVAQRLEPAAGHAHQLRVQFLPRPGPRPPAAVSPAGMRQGDRVSGLTSPSKVSAISHQSSTLGSISTRLPWHQPALRSTEYARQVKPPSAENWQATAGNRPQTTSAPDWVRAKALKLA